jgi:Uri superfamily endonuclease
MTGIYLILARLNSNIRLRIHSGRVFDLENGFYGYVGSALGGLEPRITRHLNAGKKHHWHIDYLLDYATIEMIIYGETWQRKECSVAQALSQVLTSIPAFGCSDCNCLTHLFFSYDFKKLESETANALKQSGLNPLVWYPAPGVTQINSDYSINTRNLPVEY